MRLPASETVSLQRIPQDDRTSTALSRRRFLRGAGGAAMAGAMLGSGLWRPGHAHAHKAHAASHIPGGSPLIEGLFGTLFHVYGPGAIDPADAEPSTITDFNGNVGLAFIDGTVTRTNTVTGVEEDLVFAGSDMRFMDGVFRGTDGKVHNGTFAFIWIDVYEPGPGSQLHDLNPTPAPPTGLFWTIEIPREAVTVRPGSGSATLEMVDLPLLDFGTIVNALTGATAPTPATVSFRVEWSGAEEHVKVRNTVDGFEAKLIRNQARLEFTATSGDFILASGPLSSSMSTFAEIGHERNGSFFPGS